MDFDKAIESQDKFETVAQLDFDQEWLIKEYGSGQYIITFNDTAAAYYGIEFKNDIAILHYAYVDPEFRGHKLTEKFCWYLKTRLKKKIEMSEYQSEYAIGMIKALYDSERFIIFWTKDDQKIRYNPDVDGPDDGSLTDWGDPTTFYGHLPTGWKLLIECEQYWINNPLPAFFKLDMKLLQNGYPFD